MDREPMNEHTPGEPRPAEGAPPPPPPPHSAYYMGQAAPAYYPPPPPPPPPRKSFLRRFFGALLRLIFAFFILMVLLVVIVTLFGLPSRLSGFNVTDKIGLVRIEGVISQGEEKDFWIDALRQMGESQHVKGVVVRIDSPGGTVGASQELYQAVLNIRNQHHKPVFVSMGDVAASGGYYTACAADRVYALKGTLTGSIGVIFSKPQLQGLTQKLGVEVETIKSGRFKDSGSLTRPMSEEERSMFQALIMNTYDQFVQDVLAQRKQPLAQALGRFTPQDWTAFQFKQPAQANPEAFLREIGDGRVYTGVQALQLGLIDEFGSLEDVKSALGKRVGLGVNPGVLEFTRRRGISDLFSSKVASLAPGAQASLLYMMQLP